MLMTPGDKFRMARERAGLSQGQVAKYAETAQGYISGIENNNRWPSTWELLKKLALRYRVSADYLLDLGRNVSLEAQTAGELVDALPPEKRPATVAVLRAIIELMEVGVPLPDPIEDADFAQSEPVVARDGGGVTIESKLEDAVQQKVRERKDADLALLKKMVPVEVYEEVEALVNAGHLLTEAEKLRFLDAASRNSLQQRFELLGDGDTLSRG